MNDSLLHRFAQFRGFFQYFRASGQKGKGSKSTLIGRIIKIILKGILKEKIGMIKKPGSKNRKKKENQELGILRRKYDKEETKIKKKGKLGG
jgi:hypothetical protein